MPYHGVTYRDSNNKAQMYRGIHAFCRTDRSIGAIRETTLSKHLGMIYNPAPIGVTDAQHQRDPHYEPSAEKQG